MVKIEGFSHAAVRVTDVEKSKNFYENVLGLKQLPRPNFNFGGAWYAVGDKAIHLIASQKRTGIDPLGPHLAIGVEDFEATKAALTAMGIEFLEAKTTIAGHQLWVLDPDGNTVELRTDA
jgi:glyoxylase I family protein